MFTCRLILVYDGSQFCGWQVQKNGKSIQELIEKGLEILFKTKICLVGSGRTDAGVHARGQVAHFRVDKKLSEEKLLFSLNGILPFSVRVKKVEWVSSDFHARYSALKKEYHYFLHLESIIEPFERLYRWHVRKKVNIEWIKETIPYFLGTHDFTSFSNEADRGPVAKNPIRTLFRLDPIFIEGGVRLEFEGDGFLYKMVRNIVGTLVEVGVGKKQIEEIPHIFAKKDRREAGQAAPPEGLFLIKVDYPF